MMLLLVRSAWAQLPQEPLPPLADGAGRLEPELAIDAIVMTVRRTDLRDLGILSSAPGANPWGSSFAANMTDETARSLLSRGSEVLHSLRFRVPGGKVTQLRVGSSTPVNADTPQAAYEYLDTGIEVEFAHRATTNRTGVPLTLAARLQIRSGNSGGGLARTVFTTHPIQYEARVPDGSTIVFGGFINELDSRLLTGMKGTGASTLLRHLFSEEERRRETEIVVLLALPRRGELSGAPSVLEPAPAPSKAVVPPSAPAEPTPVPAGRPVPPPPLITAASPAAAPVSESAPAPARTPGQSLLTVQVGAFGSREAAQTLVRDLSAHYSDVSMQVVPGDKPLYRVRVGNFTNRDAARQIENRLRGDGLSTFITPLN